jgi:type I restriction enzyme S subunit
VPPIRFEGFSEEWLKRKLVDNFKKIIDFRGRTPKKLGLDWSEAGYLALSALNVKNGFIDLNVDAHFGNDELYEKWMLGNELHKNQVLFTTEAPMGNVAQVPDDNKYILSQRTIAFEVNSTLIEENFLAKILGASFVQKKLTSLSSGGTAQGVSQKSLSTVDVVIPKNITEQIKIGNYFQQLDTLITQHQKKHDKLLSIKKSLLEKMFPKQGITKPEIRFKGFSGEWELCELGKHSIIKGRLGWKSLKQNEYLDDGPSMIAGRHVTNGVINWNVVDHIPEWRYFESPEIMLKNDDIIFSKDGSLGNPAIIKNLQGFATINSTMMLVRPGKKLVSDFFFQVLKTKRFDDLIKLKVSGSSIPHLFQADMNQFEFDYPAPEEQRKIGKLFKQLDTLISQHKAQLKKFSNIRQACLEKMFV